MLLAFSFALNLLTIVLATIPMRLARAAFGRSAYWLLYLVVGAGAVFFAIRTQSHNLASLGVAFLAMTMMMGLFAELELRFKNVFWAGLVAVGVTSAAVIGGVLSWAQATKFDLLASLRDQAQSLAAKMASVDSGSAASVDSLVQQIPSAVVVGLITALAAGLIWEKRAAVWFQVANPNLNPRSDLLNFRTPDVFFWLALAALLGAYGKHGVQQLQIVSENLINVLIVVYFLQGLAIVAHFFESMKVGPLWQMILYFLIVVQLFLLVSVIGFVDFWLDLRERISKKQAEINKSV